ncbi:putative hemagglutinin/hemolysin-related protein [Chryseobacterium sp. StRB126]|nr:putative hemagglutinin/hemolysin-related protein [Chryseobacterium sp. StRB126]
MICLRQERTEYTYKLNLDNIHTGEVILEIGNPNKTPIKVSEKIDNNALVVTAFQKSDTEAGVYEDIDFARKHFDCFIQPCFPYKFLLKKDMIKQYKFRILSSTYSLKKDKWYRFKVSLETSICKNCDNISSDWIYFKR